MLVAADRMMVDGEIRRDYGLKLDDAGRIANVGPLAQLGEPDLNLSRRVIFPGFVNVHSHAFQRVLRGRTQVAGPVEDNFWTWREKMYLAASKLTPDDVFVIARQAFMEMLLCGVTSVGEFHYVHHKPSGGAYADPSELAMAVARAACDVGMRLRLLRTVYLRGGFDTSPSELQQRFCEPSIDISLGCVEALIDAFDRAADPRLSVGVAAHSVRAMPIDSIVALKTSLIERPFHIHVSEQRREVERCKEVHGVGPVALLAESGVLDGLTTLVHATHLEPGEAKEIQLRGSSVCVCPSTEADLGDGLIEASRLMRAKVPLCLGTDGQTRSSILEEARLLEMHERLHVEKRTVLSRAEGDEPARYCLDAATKFGARSLDLEVGELAQGLWGDLAVFDLDDPHLGGLDDDSLLAGIIYSADSRALTDVMVGGEWVVRERQHAKREESAQAFAQTAARIYG